MKNLYFKGSVDLVVYLESWYSRPAMLILPASTLLVVRPVVPQKKWLAVPS